MSLRPASGFKSALRALRAEKAQTRTLTTATFGYREPTHHVSGKLYMGQRASPDRLKKLQIPPTPPSIKKRCAEPTKVFVAEELAGLDPAGTRRRLINRTNPDRLKVGDVAMVRFRTGEPFAGVVMNVRHRGPDSAILLRNQLTRIGTEMWIKIFSPTVSGVEIVQRSERRMRRARAYYLRKPKHDRGSLAGLVENYIRQSRILGRGTGRSGSSTGGQTKTK